MTLFEKHFTLNDARAALPDLRRRIIRINDLIADIRSKQARDGASLLAVARGNGKGPILSGIGIQKEEAQRLIESIAEQGIQIKDLEKGLVDFPHFLNGDSDHEVFLCWHLEEDSIEYWHEIDAGFAGREHI